LVRPGALFFITVPAFEFLWSDHDKYLGHFRRYTLKKLERLLKEAGLSILHGHYFYVAVFPIAAGMRLLGNWLPHRRSQTRSHLKKHHPIVNKTLFSICRVERILSRYNRFMGLSSVVLGRKSNS